MKRALLLLCLLLWPAAGRAARADCGGEGWRPVKTVFDGDTLQLKGGEKVRLLGIDAPELHDSAKLDRDVLRTHHDRKVIQAMGDRSYRVFKELVGEGPVRLEYDGTTRDKYGRTLAYVYGCLRAERFATAVQTAAPPKKSAGVVREYQLNREMVRYGWAEAYRRFDYREKPDFIALEKRAREDGLGLWKEE